MSLIDIPNKKYDEIKMKYSLNEMGKNDYSATFFDSFHKSNLITPYLNTQINIDAKTNNYFLALKSLTSRERDDSFEKLLISEFSERSGSRESKIIPQNHYHLLTNDIIKNTNALIKLNIKKSKNDVTVYRNINNTTNIFKFKTQPNSNTNSSEDEVTIIDDSNSSINDIGSKISSVSNQVPSTTITKRKKQINIWTEPKSKLKNFNSNIPEKNLEVINDLEEPCDIKLKDYEIKGNIFKKNKESIDSNRPKQIFFNNSINNKFHIKKFSCRNSSIFNNAKTSTMKKLRKKFERSEFRKTEFHTIQANRRENNDGFLENKNININLMDKFNYWYNKGIKINKTLINKLGEINDVISEPEYDFLNPKNDYDTENKNKISVSIISDIKCDKCSDYEQNNKISDLVNSNNNNNLQSSNNSGFNNEINNGTDKDFSNDKSQSEDLLFYNIDKETLNDHIKNIKLNNASELVNKKKYCPKSPTETKKFDLLSPFKNIKNGPNLNSNNKKKGKKTKYLNSQNKKKKPNIYYKKMYQKYTNDSEKENSCIASNNGYINHSKSIYDMTFYNNLLEINNSYKKINIETIFQKHSVVTWETRLNCLLWMMEICEEFAYKRDTFHYSCFYFDLYLTLTNQIIIDKKELNLIGITCISISAKLEEVQIPKLEEYVQSIDECYNKNDIIIMEQEICKYLGWKLIPVTLSIWLNWYICQWDLFYDSVDEIRKYLLHFIDEENIIYYKKQCEESYYNFRKIYQLIDLIVLDYRSYNYDMRCLVAAAFFCCLCICNGVGYDFANRKLKIRNFSSPISELTAKALLDVYIIFIGKSFGFSFYDMDFQETILYVYKFHNYKFNYEIPLIFQLDQQKLEESSYEDFISYQTTDNNISAYFKNLYKFNSNGNDSYISSLNSFSQESILE